MLDLNISLLDNTGSFCIMFKASLLLSHAILTQLLWLTYRPIPAREAQQIFARKAQHGATPGPDVAWRRAPSWCCCCLGGGPHGHRSHDAAHHSWGQPSPRPDGRNRQPRH